MRIQKRRLSLDQLADHAGLSLYHFHRVFKAITGVTPREYAASHRTKRVRSSLGKSDTVTEAIYDAGYNSNGRFYETSNEVLGMTPSNYRAGGTGAEIRFAVGECSLGSILVAASARGVCAILLGDDPAALARDLQDQFPQARLIGGDARFEQLVSKVVGFVEAPALGFELPLDVRGTAFQQRVWQALRKIPAGSTATYTDIAKRIGSPRRSELLPKPAAQMFWPSRSHAIASFAPTAHYRATAGASSASALFSNGRRRHEGKSQGAPLIHPQAVAARVKTLDWESVSHDLDAQGNAMIERLLSPDECQCGRWPLSERRPLPQLVL